MLVEQRNKRILTRIAALACSFVLFFGVVGVSLAQTGSAAPPSEGSGLSWVANTVGNFILYIGSYVTGFGGLLLETSIDKFIIRINEMIGNGTPLGKSIDAVWVLIRDICNLAFIFGFIYIGIRTILDADSSATKRMLASIIIGALLINFSLFFAKTIIDVSHYISYEIYTKLVDTQNGGSITTAFREILGLRGFYSPPSAAQTANMTVGGNISYFFMATLMLIVAGFVFAAGAVLLMIRFVVLVLILCFSPVLFAATVFPGTQEHASKLWKQLISYSFFAPVYLLLLVVSIKVLQGAVSTLNGNKTDLSQALLNTNAQGSTPIDMYGVILIFGVGIFFLIMSLQIATKFGIAGAEKTIAFGNSLRGRVQSAVGRNFVGRGSEYLLKKYEARTARDSQNRAKMGTLRRFTNNTAKFGLAAVGIDDRSIRGALKAGKEAKFGGNYSRADDKSYAEEQSKRFATSNALGDFKSTVKNNTNRKNPDGTPFDLTKLPEEDKVALERAVADASVKYLEELSQKDREAIVGFMSQSQIEGLEKSDALTDEEKSGLSNARRDYIGRIYESNKELLSKANADSLAALGADYFNKSYKPENVVHLTSSQMDDLKKKFTPTEYAQISKNREEALLSLASGGEINSSNSSGAIVLTQDHLIKQKPGEIAKMPSKVLVKLSTNAATQIPIAALSKISQEGTLARDDQQAIRANILSQIRDGSLLKAAEYTHWLENTPLGSQFGN